MSKSAGILAIFILILFIGYIYKFFPRDETFGFPYSPLLSSGKEIRLTQSWYMSIVLEKFRYVILSWALWFHGIPKKESVVRFGAAIICVNITLLPVFWMLFYKSPNQNEWFIAKIVLSLLIFTIYTYGGVWNRSD